MKNWNVEIELVSGKLVHFNLDDEEVKQFQDGGNFAPGRPITIRGTGDRGSCIHINSSAVAMVTVVTVAELQEAQRRANEKVATFAREHDV